MSDPTDLTASAAYLAGARSLLPRGVSSTPRASQLPLPVVQASAEGVQIIDLDGNRYIDYALGYGPLILGHTPGDVIGAVEAELMRGLRSGGVHEGEGRLAQTLVSIVPGAEQATYLSSGTEAILLALRLARAGTGRTDIIKFRAHYHGWADSIQIATSHGNDGPATAGQETDIQRHIRVVDWGDLDALESALDSSVAGVIMEPAAIGPGCFAPAEGFLETALTLTHANGSLMIFDEIISGFRLALGGASERYGVHADVTVLGKALGAGLPISAVTGSREAMTPMSDGRLSQRGTYNGNPVSVAAAQACLDYLMANRHEVYPQLERQAQDLAASVRDSAVRHAVPVAINQLGGCLQLFAGVERVDRISTLGSVDMPATRRLVGHLTRHGIMTMPTGRMYLSAVHTDADIAATAEAFDAAIIDWAQEPIALEPTT